MLAAALLWVLVFGSPLHEPFGQLVLKPVAGGYELVQYTGDASPAEIPDNVVSIAETAFSGCDGLVISARYEPECYGLEDTGRLQWVIEE